MPDVLQMQHSATTVQVHFNTATPSVPNTHYSQMFGVFDRCRTCQPDNPDIQRITINNKPNQRAHTHKYVCIYINIYHTHKAHTHTHARTHTHTHTHTHAHKRSQLQGKNKRKVAGHTNQITDPTHDRHNNGTTGIHQSPHGAHHRIACTRHTNH